MPSYDAITDMLRRKAQELEQMKAAAEALSKIGSLENAIAENEKKLQDVQAKVTDAETQLTVAEASTAKAARDAKEIIKRTDQQIADKLSSAEIEGVAIIEQAKAAAAVEVDALKAAQKSVLAKLAKQVEKAQTELTALEQTIANANNTIAVRTAEADKVEKRLEEIRKSIAALTGANV